ncbi:proton channel OtopLc isoform X6 [Drosophila gunungcola]|uniref:proton channel OtopLc isoform X6 n=1 Tax=Drosophila gunungcola TaxID=103775 RepID=UPI0022E83FE3|nr:proton channel OtopLc isoform X6 [Drosophila gunungcola]
MQRCPYIHEMRERLLDQPRETLQLENMERANLLDNRQSASESNQLQGDGYHTSPAHQRTPLVPHDLGEDFNLDFDDDFPIDARRPKNAKTSLFIVTSLVYAILLIVVCIAYVISDVTTHRLPVLYYETFFTYLYGVSILFLLYVFCFLLQESSCCNGGNGGSKPKPQPKEKKSKKAKNADPADSKDAKGSKDSGKAAKGAAYQHTLAKFLEAPVDAEVAVTPKNVRKRKTTHSDLTHGSFFLRVGAIAFGLGAMIYIGLEFGSFFEIPFDSPCHHILIGVNPLLQMIFTFMQMYFIFMNARLNIHRFKVIARFGLMHVVATNICVWIRTLVKESLLEITIYHQKNEPEAGASSIAHSIRQHALRHAGTVLRTHTGPNSEFEVLDGEDILPKDVYKSDNVLSKLVRNTVDGISKSLGMGGGDQQVVAGLSTTSTTTTRAPFTTPNYQWHSTTMARKLKKFITSATTAATTAGSSSSSTSTISPTSSAASSTATTIITPTSTAIPSSSTTFSPFSTATTAALNLETSGSDSPFGGLQRILSSAAPPSLAPVDGFGSAATPLPVSVSASHAGSFVDSFLASTLSPASSTEGSASIMNNLFGQGPMENSFQTYTDLGHEEATGLVSFENLESLDSIYPAALSSNIGTLNSTACGRIDIMGTIVYDSAPYLYPFIIEYSLIGAVVLYVMWKHIGRYPGRMNDEDLEHRLEVMLSRRAVAMAQQARSGRVDCVGSSKGLFFGLLLLVGALICLILFFVLVRHQQFSLLAIYLADASHCILMAFAILAIIVGFIRVKNLKFRCEEQSNLNDILLRISAFGLFTYSVFSIIAGSLKVLESEPSLLVTTTGGVAVFQVILQLLFIADVSRRRVHLPEHDRSKPGRQIVTFLLICNVAMFAIYTFEAQKVFANPVSRYVQLEFYGFVPWSIIQRITLPLCIFHRFHSAVTLAEIWKTTYKARLE